MSVNKIAIFVEGQSELVFIRNLLRQLFDNSSIVFDCIKLHGSQTVDIPYKHCPPEPTAYFQIINVENDSKVLSAIKEREQKLFQNGFSKIIGLRDMYSKEYRKRVEGCINDEVNNKFVESHDNVISFMSSPEKISFHFSIMEIEAWWLGMETLFEKVDSRLNSQFIGEYLDFFLESIDPETSFFHPAETLKQILALVNIPYDKKLGQVESITSKISIEDVETLLRTEKCASFKKFYESLLSSTGDEKE